MRARNSLKDCQSARQIPTWVCIAYFESRFKTNAKNLVTHDFGIFQINSKYWCKDGNGSGGGCNKPCSAFLDNDIRDDIACARHIYQKTRAQSRSHNGFTAWTTWRKYCGKDNRKWVRGC